MIDNLLCEVSNSRDRKSFGIIGIAVLLLLSLGTNNVLAVDSYAQNKRLTLEVTNITMRDVFNEIEKNSEYIFFYSDEVNVYTKVAVNVSDRTIDEIMKQMLRGTDYTYTVSDRQVFIKKSPKQDAVVSVEVVNQQKMVSGIIVDKVGDPIIGANVVLKGNTTIGTITDLDGKFTLSVPDGAVLIVSYIGYTTQEVPVGANTALKIQLADDATVMDEVVVVGYGVQKKVNLTGSISTVSTEDLQGRTNFNLLQSLQGTAPGVTIVSRPGQTPSINIRGRGNLGTSEPLYVIDGAISTATTFANLDPNSIESVSILKDAASSAIYGSRAAYGVILVTTKKGAKEGFNVTYDGMVGFKNQTYKPEVVNSEWYARLINESKTNAGEGNLIPQSTIDEYISGKNPDLYPNTDWYDLVFQDQRVMTTHTLGFSGTAGKTNYYASLGYTYNDDFQKGKSNDRYNANMNITSQLKPWLKLRAGMRYTEYVLDQTTGDVNMAYLMQSPPTYVARHSNGEYGSVDGGVAASGTFINRNPLRVLEQGGWRKRNHKTTVFDGALDFTLYKDLILTTQITSDYHDYKDKRYQASMPAVPSYLDPESAPTNEKKDNQMDYEWYERRRMTYGAMLNYNITFGSHSIQALAGTTYETYNYQQQKSERKNFPTNSMQAIGGEDSAPADSRVWGKLTEEKLLSYFGRINYSFMDRYLLEINMRADASSRFHKDNRWGYFPSFSAGWRLSEEEFMKRFDWMDNMKIRASWGQLGNINNVGEYDYFAAYALGKYNYSFGGNTSTAVYESKIPNSKLGWETVTMTDIGFDAGFFGNRLTLSADWYLKKTTDILLEYDVLREVGATNKVSQNIGELENRGLEFVIGHNNRIGELTYSVSANFSKNWNKITYLGGADYLQTNDMWIKAVGQAIGTFYGYQTNGLLSEGEKYVSIGNAVLSAGDVKYVDRGRYDENGKFVADPDGKLNEADKTFLGKDVPDFTYGGSINLAYKNFDLSIFGQGVSGTKVYMTMEAAHPFADNAPPREWHKKRWTVENPNPNAAYPRLLPQGHAAYKNNIQNYSDFWLFDADYFRIKNITLGYTFPRNIINNIGINSLRVYMSSENPFTIRADKRMKDFDPEMASDRGKVSTGTRSFIFGVNVSF